VRDKRGHEGERCGAYLDELVGEKEKEVRLKANSEERPSSAHGKRRRDTANVRRP